MLHEALQGLQIRYASLSNAKPIWTKMKNQNVNLCIMTQGLQIRYALLSNAKLILTKLKNLNINLCIMTQDLQIRYALLPVHYAEVEKRG